jgi:hypothetical protein
MRMEILSALPWKNATQLSGGYQLFRISIMFAMAGFFSVLFNPSPGPETLGNCATATVNCFKTSAR